MNKLTNRFGIGLMLALVAVFLVSVSQTQAAEVNIVVGSDLTIGSTGQSVVVLQGLLSELGYLNVPAGIPFGYYGPLTRSAVAKYQAAQNVAPAVGYFGPLTKVGMHSHFASRNWLGLLGW